MGLPSINIVFKTAAANAITRSQKGVVALILKDANKDVQGSHTLFSAAAIPAKLNEANREYVARTFEGYVTSPRKVLLYVLPGTAEDLGDTLTHFATQEFDYLCGPPDCTEVEAAAIASHIKSRRGKDYTDKAVLPNHKADHEGIINFTTEDIQVGEKTCTTAAYCSRIAGLIAGTPMTMACTFATLPEVTDIKRVDDIDASIDGGEFVLYHDGEKVKVGRGVTSLTTTTQDKGDPYKKIKTVETVDMIRKDIKRTAEDSYIGKYSNSYENKCLLITAIKGYLETLESAGILDTGSTVEIDLEAQMNYLQSTGLDVDSMSEQQIKAANTGDKVFLAIGIKILDAIEEITIVITH